jgi:hypothetical protein
MHCAARIGRRASTVPVQASPQVTAFVHYIGDYFSADGTANRPAV